jgi:hypothetical protein
MHLKITNLERDPRRIDLMAALALLILMVATWHFYAGAPALPPPRR